jgi:hypothetical protein
MAINNTRKLPLEPRLPIVGGADYDQRLSRSLHDIFRQLSARVNALDGSGTGFVQLTAASTTTIPAGAQFVNLTGSGTINTLAGGADGQVIVITCTDSPRLYALGIFDALEPNSIVIAECVSGDWYLRGHAAKSPPVLPAYKVTRSMGAGSHIVTINHDLGYPPHPADVTITLTSSSMTALDNNLQIVGVPGSSTIQIGRNSAVSPVNFAMRIST